MSNLIPYNSLQSPGHFQSDRGATIEAIIGGWLQSKDNRSHSPKTQTAYRNTIKAFREMLLTGGYDLISYDENFIPTIADYAQVFASLRSGKSTRAGAVRPATFNQRLAILSSFYDYALKRRHITSGNPIDAVDRPTVEAYEQARTLHDDIETRLKEIDPETLQGARDLALLALLLSTGRRVSEVANLRLKDIQAIGNQYKVFFERTKGGKSISDTLSQAVSKVLTDWLVKFYGLEVKDIPKDKPLWVNVHHKSHLGEPLGYHGIAGICQHYLGTSKVHTTRHTFAMLMELAGAKITDIQKRLQHKNAATTGVYLEKLTQDRNPYADKIAASLGLNLE